MGARESARGAAAASSGGAAPAGGAGGAARELPLSVAFATAGVGGIIGWAVVHPANTLAVRMNLEAFSTGGGAAGGDAAAAATAAPKRMSFVRFARDVVAAEGVGSLYKGLSAGLVRQSVYATARFGLYEVLRDAVAARRAGGRGGANANAAPPQLDFGSRLAVGLASGAAAALLSCPAEVTLVRMSNDAALPADQRRNYRGLLDAGRRVVSEEGIATFWRGSRPFVSRAMVVGATQVATYDQLAQVYRGMGVAEGVPLHACAASSAGFIYSVLTNPLETAKNRQAFQKPLPDGTLPYRGTLQTIGAIARSEGPAALWMGFMPYFLRCGGHTIVMFLSVQQLRSWYWSAVGRN